MKKASKKAAAAASGRELFHAIWQKVSERFYDQERLVALNWAGQKHRFDKQIVDDASAIRCAEVLLATLGEKYTKLLSAEQVVAKREGRVSEELYAYNKKLANNIGYIGISSFDHSNIAEQVRERLEGIADCDAFIVDVRGNGGGLLDETSNVLELFIDEGEICTIEVRTERGVSENYVYFTHEHYVHCYQSPGKEAEKDLCLRHQAMIAGRPMVLLIDGDTASSAELFSAALLESGRSDKSIIAMGTKTGGKGIGQADFDILGKATVKISCICFYSPTEVWFGDAAQTVNNGIEPDVYLADNDDPKVAVHEAARYLTNMLSKAA